MHSLTHARTHTRTCTHTATPYQHHHKIVYAALFKCIDKSASNLNTHYNATADSECFAEAIQWLKLQVHTT